MIANQENTAQVVKVKRKGKVEAVELGRDEQNIALTRKQLAVLDVLMDPDNAQKSDTEMSDIAGVSRTTFYRVRMLPEVDAERRRLCKALIQSRVAPIIDRSIKVAMSEGRDGFQDRRLLLSMSGDYVERQQHDVNLTARVMVGVVGVSMDELG